MTASSWLRSPWPEIAIFVTGVTLTLALRPAPRAESTPTEVAPAPPSASAVPSAPDALPRFVLSDEHRAAGFEECNPPDPAESTGWGEWKKARGLFFAIPQSGGVRADGGYDVVIHFHGKQPARRVLEGSARGIVLVGLDAGLGSGAYSKLFPLPADFGRLLERVETTLREQTGRADAHIAHLALSGWSAGYGAIEEIVERSADRVDAVILLDGMHASWPADVDPKDPSRKMSDANVRGLFDFAKAAAAPDARQHFFFTHSQIVPPTYPSTTQTGDLLLAELGLPRVPVADDGTPYGLASQAERGNLHVFGFRGGGTEAHCSHLFELAPIVARLERLWDTPPMARVPREPAWRAESEARRALGMVGSASAGVELVPVPDGAPGDEPAEGALGADPLADTGELFELSPAEMVPEEMGAASADDPAGPSAEPPPDGDGSDPNPSDAVPSDAVPSDGAQPLGAPVGDGPAEGAPAGTPG